MQSKISISLYSFFFLLSSSLSSSSSSYSDIVLMIKLIFIGIDVQFYS